MYKADEFFQQSLLKIGVNASGALLTRISSLETIFGEKTPANCMCLATYAIGTQFTTILLFPLGIFFVLFVQFLYFSQLWARSFF